MWPSLPWFGVILIKILSLMGVSKAFGAVRDLTAPRLQRLCNLYLHLLQLYLTNVI